MTTIGQIVSRLRASIKANSEDAFVTDRFLYSLVTKYAHDMIRRDNVLNTIINFNSIIKTIPCVELIEVDKVSDTCCLQIKSGCVIKRTKEKVLNVVESKYGPIFRSVSSLDGSLDFNITTPSTFNSISNSTTFKYNNTKYYWFTDGYLYFPNVDYDAVKVEGIFEDDVTNFLCGKDQCVQRQDDTTFIPDYLHSAIEQMVLKELFARIQIPAETADDKQNINR